MLRYQSITRPSMTECYADTIIKLKIHIHGKLAAGAATSLTCMDTRQAATSYTNLINKNTYKYHMRDFAGQVLSYIWILSFNDSPAGV